MRSTYNHLQPPKVGKPLTRTWVENVTQKLNDLNTLETSPTPYLNPLLLRVKNMTDKGLEMYSVLRITTPEITDTKAFPQILHTQMNEFLGYTPEGSDDEKIGITTYTSPPTTVVPCVVSGPTPVKIRFPNEASFNYPYAVPIEGDTTQLQASPFGKILILWHETPTNEQRESTDIALYAWGLVGDGNQPLFFKLNADLTSETSATAIIVDETGEPLGDGIEKTIYAPVGAEGETHRWKKDSIVVAQWSEYLKKWIIPSTDYSEVFGKLTADWVNTERSAEITLDTDFKVFGEKSLIAYASPTLPSSLSAGTAVTCRFIKARGEWFFFRPAQGSENYTVLDCSGTALWGLGTHTDGRKIWATTLSPFSVPVNLYSTLALLKKQKAVAGQINWNGKNEYLHWVEFPTNLALKQTSGFQYGYAVRRPSYVLERNGELYFLCDDGDGATIYKMDDAYYRYGANGGYYRMETLYNGEKLYKYGKPTEWEGGYVYVYYDGFGEWIRGELGRLHTLDEDYYGYHSRDTSGSGEDAVPDPLTQLIGEEYAPPCWTRDGYGSNYRGEFTPQNGASGTFIFGRAQWNLTDGTHRAVFQDKWDADDDWLYIENKNNASHYSEQFNGGYFATCDGERKRFFYGTTISGNGRTAPILGKRYDNQNGWYELENGTEFATEGEQKMVFKIEERGDITFTPSYLLEYGMDILEHPTEDYYYIKESDVSFWKIAKSDVQEEFTFTFTLPDGLTDEEIAEKTQENKTVTLENIIKNEWDSIGISKPRRDGSDFVIGTPNDPNGWRRIEASKLQTSYAMQHTAVEREDIAVSFRDYNGEDGTEEIWLVTPEIMT